MKSKGKNKAMVAPLLPLTFILGYQYDLAYGEKMERMRSKYIFLLFMYNYIHVFFSHGANLVKVYHSKNILDIHHFHNNLDV